MLLKEAFVSLPAFLQVSKLPFSTSVSTQGSTLLCFHLLICNHFVQLSSVAPQLFNSFSAMPTDPSRTTHTTGPSSLGHSPHTGQRVPQQLPTNLPFTGQVGPHPGLAPHLQHVPNGAPPPMPYGPMPPPRQMLPTHSTPPQQGPTHFRPQNSQQYFMNPSGFGGYHQYMSNFMYPGQTFYMSHGEASQQPPQQPRPMSAYPPPALRMSTGTVNPPPVVLPVPKKKIMPIVDPETKEEIKVSKADTSASSRNSIAASPSASPPVRVEPRPARPLAVVPDPSDSHRVTSKTPVDDTSVAHTDTTTDISKSDISEVNLESSQEPADVHGADDAAQMSSHPTGPKQFDQSAEIPAADVKGNVNVPDSNVSQINDNSDEAVTPITQESSDSHQPSQPSANEPSVTTSSTKPAAGESLQPEDPSLTMDSSVSFVTNQSGDSSSNQGPSDTVAQPSLPDNSAMLSAPSETMVPNGDSEKEATKDDQQALVEPSTDSPLLSDSKEGSQRTDNSDLEGEIVTEDVLKNDKATSSTSLDASSSKEEIEAESLHPEKQVMTFAPGQRRVYAPEFLLSLRSSANQKRMAEFKSAMTPSDIFGSNRSASTSSNRLMTSASGPLSSDPRGTRAFPPHSSSGFQMGSMRGPLSGMMGPGGFHDGPDMRAPRFAPPPVSRTPSVRDGDPRGSRTQRPNQRAFDGFMRRGQMPVEAAIPHPPVEKLKRSSTGWHRNKEADDEITAKVKQVRSLLNKLTLEKFDRIFDQIIAIDLSSYDVLVGVVKEIFEKTLFEPKFSDMYAELCSRLDTTLQPILSKKSDPNDQLNFRRILLNNCKEEFVRFANSSKPTEPTSKGDQSDSGDKSGDDSKSSTVDEEKAGEEADIDKLEADLRASNAKRRMLANVRFIGELFLKDLISETIIHKQCIQKLLQLALETKEEDVLEAMCKLISKTGAKLSANVNAKGHIERYFQLLVQLSRDQKVPARIRFMIQDLLEQRDNDWKVRREEAGAKTIAEIHRDIEKEEKAKADAANALRDRRSRGGGGSRHTAPGSNFPPRVAMMMASRPTSTPGMSRTNMTLEKLNNVKTSGLASTLPQGMRLGPGGRGNMASAGSGTPALRPNGSRSTGGSRYSLLSSMNMSDVPSADEGSGDVRRSKTSKTSTGPSRPVSEPGSSAVSKIELMNPSIVKRKAKSILEEYWSIYDLKEATSCLEEEVKAPNYPLFIEEAVKLSLEAKMDTCQKSCTLFSAWAGNKTVPVRIFVTVLQKFGPMLEDIEMDFPIVAELYAKVAYSLAEVPEFKEAGGGKYGLNWMKPTFDACEHKKAISKFVVRILKFINTSLKDKTEEERQSEVIDVYESLDIDLAAELSAWDDMMGPRTLRGILDRSDMLFLIDTLGAELQLRSVVDAEPAVADCVNALQTFKGSLDGRGGKNMMQMAIRVGLDSVFVCDGDTKELIEKIFVTVAKAIKEVFGKDINREVQMAALQALQLYVARNSSKIAHFSKDKAWAESACRALYDAGVVAGERFLEWKGDDRETGKLAGKDQMVNETEGFFKWLAEA